MYSKNDGKITLLRNEASIFIDDLVALVVNSAVAYQLREFSSEVMEQTPGFTFNLSQAKNLRDLARKTYKQYKAGDITDVDLMSFPPEARTILKGDSETLQNGGKQMGIFNKLLHGKEIKKQEAVAKTENEYQAVCKDIMTCQEKMDRCIKESRGQAPDSAVYRNNERVYSTEKKRMTLLRQKEATLRKILQDADRIKLIEEFGEWQASLATDTAMIFGNEKDLDKLMIKAQMQSDRNSELASRYENFGEDLFTSAEETAEASRASDEFSSQVAAEERRQTLRDFADVPEEAMSQTVADPADEFSALVSEKRD